MTDAEIKALLRNQYGRLALPDAIEQALLPPEDPALQRTRRSVGLPPSSASAVIRDPVTGMEGVIGSCMRKTWYMLKDVPQDPAVPEARSERLKHGGDLYSQAYVYEPAKRAGLWAGDEIAFFDEENLLSGRLDLMAFLPRSTVKSGVEVKTMSPFFCTPYVRAGARGFERLEPRFSDLPQTMTYMKHWMRYGVRVWHLYYMTWDHHSGSFALMWANVPDNAVRPNKDSYLTCMSNEGEFDMPWLTWGQVSDRYAATLEHLRNDTPPPRDFQKQYSNAFLLEASKHSGNGSQIVQIGITDAKKIEQKFQSQCSATGSKNPNDHAIYLEKGDAACSFCPWAQTCWSGLGNPLTPRVPAATFDIAKSPQAPVVDKIAMARPDKELI